MKENFKTLQRVSFSGSTRFACFEREQLEHKLITVYVLLNYSQLS